MGKTSKELSAVSKISPQKLKNYLLSDFGDHKYKRKSIIEIRFYNPNYFSSLKKSGKIRPEVIDFFENEADSLKSAESISVDAFRNLKYEEIVNNYIEKVLAQQTETPDKNSVQKSASTDVPDLKESNAASSNMQASSGSPAIHSKANDIPKREKPTTNKSTVEKQPVKTTLHCISDGARLLMTDKKTVLIKGKRTAMPRLCCPKCDFLYTSVQSLRDLTVITFQGQRYTNILSAEDDDRYDAFLKKPHTLEPGSKCIVYNKNDAPYLCKKCRTVLKEKKNITGKLVHKTLYCPNCDIHYLKFTIYGNYKNKWTLLNPDDYDTFEETRIQKQQAKAERKKQRALQQLLDNDKTRLKLERLQRQEELRRQRALASQQRKELFLRERQRLLQEEESKHPTKLDVPKKTVPRNVKDSRIHVKDFVVRRSTFRCMHEGHNLQNVDGIIDIINNKGNIVQTTVPAGYCPNCNVFFIMESTYQRLKIKGTPMCRISDEKAYMKINIYANGMRLAPESVLMQYGYTVSQQEDLTESRRQKILAVLIDNNILTRTDIISYLDFFINQRKSQHKYEKAIGKWENDREFVSEYKKGAYSQYGVRGISRKY